MIPLIIIALGALLIFGGISGLKIGDLITGKETQGSEGGSTSASNAPGVPPTFPTPTISTPPDLKSPIVVFAKRFLGVPYKWGGNDPTVGIDCSRFVQLVMSQFGVNLPRTSQEQYASNLGTHIPLGDILPGDVIYTIGSDGTLAAPGHEGLYVGNGLVQESPYKGLSNRYTPLSVFLGTNNSQLVGVKRFVK